MSKIISQNTSANLSSGVLTNVTFSNNQIQLSLSGSIDGTTTYQNSGTYETPVIDMTKFFKQITSITNTSTLPAGTSLTIYTSTSNDGVNFGSYEALDGDGKITSLQRQFIKIKIELNGASQTFNRTLNDFAANESTQFNVDSQLTFDGSLYLKNVYQNDMEQDISFTDEGTLLKQSLNKSSFNKIDKIEVI